MLQKKPQLCGQNIVYRTNFAFHKALNIISDLESTTHENFLYTVDNKIQEIVGVHCLKIIQIDLNTNPLCTLPYTQFLNFVFNLKST